MVLKIQKPIVDYKVADAASEKEEQQERLQNQSTEEDLVYSTIDGNSATQYQFDFQRPEVLEGKTYKIKTPLSEHALYVTINDLVFNVDTEVERRRPYEIFINSKNMEHFQWIVAVTRLISAVFRNGGNTLFIVEEMEAIFDPRGGYFRKGGNFTPSLVAEIGSVIKMHMEKIGMIQKQEMSDETKQFLDEKRLQFETRNSKNAADSGSEFPAGAELCYVCSTKAMIYLDGCLTCLNCGDSKCS